MQIEVTQMIEGKERIACSAKFVMAARDKKTNKSYQVPPMNLEGEPENMKIKYQFGEKGQLLRKEEAKKNLKISPPTHEESTLIHNLLIEIEKDSDRNKSMKMSETKEKTALLMHLQEKNLSGKIFGGFILRLAYELGWLAVFKFLKGDYPKCIHIDDVQFLGPVEIGSFMELSATISYITTEIIHVVVNCHNVKGNGERSLTNILRISF